MTPTVKTVDLHVHSTASDGLTIPGGLGPVARDAGLSAFALTDHDTMAGIAPARAAADGIGLELVPGCEFSTGTSWGELHLLAYFLAPTPALDTLFERQEESRAERAIRILDRLRSLGVPVALAAVERVAGGAPLARPHIARTMVQAGLVGDVSEAFERYLSDAGPAFVAKQLPDLEEVVRRVREAGGVTSAAHLKDRATRGILEALKAAGVDAVEVLHPAHSRDVSRALDDLAGALGLLKTGGSDYHGRAHVRRRRLGGMQVPPDWLERLRERHDERVAAGG